MITDKKKMEREKEKEDEIILKVTFVKNFHKRRSIFHGIRLNWFRTNGVERLAKDVPVHLLLYSGC